MDNQSEAKLSKVHPLLALKIRELFTNLDGDYRVVSGLRTYAEQDALFAQGRTKAGIIVTKARAGQSNHNFGLACDICLFVNGQPDWNNNAAFVKMGHAAESLGLEWGGDWPKFIDKPHVQLPGLTVVQCRSLYNKGGLPRVWAAIGDILVPAPKTPATHPQLKLGDRGEQVGMMQQALNRHGFSVKVDSIFGKATEEALNNFQESKGLDADGACGPLTWGALDK